jgi:serine protease
MRIIYLAVLLLCLAVGASSISAGAEKAALLVPSPMLSDAKWHLSGQHIGVNPKQAWRQLKEVGRPGGQGVTVAVVDTGVNDSNAFRPGAIIGGWNFVDGSSAINDTDGHGTFVAGLIAGTEGVAYGAQIMPIQVMGSDGHGEVIDIADGIMYAADNQADIINLSMEISLASEPQELLDISEAVRYAHDKGALVVASAGNQNSSQLPLPAASIDVLSVGATTAGGCRAAYSSRGPELDLMAPGGGLPENGCPSTVSQNLYQLTAGAQEGSLLSMSGTSAAAPLVSGVAALLIASGQLGSDPSPAAIQKRLQDTAYRPAEAGPDSSHGFGLVDASAALSPLP